MSKKEIQKVNVLYAGVIIGTKKSRAKKARKHWGFAYPNPKLNIEANHKREPLASILEISGSLLLFVHGQGDMWEAMWYFSATHPLSVYIKNTKFSKAGGLRYNMNTRFEIQ